MKIRTPFICWAALYFAIFMGAWGCAVFEPSQYAFHYRETAEGFPSIDIETTSTFGADNRLQNDVIVQSYVLDDATTVSQWSVTVKASEARSSEGQVGIWGKTTEFFENVGLVLIGALFPR